jgi:hypothetical protein
MFVKTVQPSPAVAAWRLIYVGALSPRVRFMKLVSVATFLVTAVAPPIIYLTYTSPDPSASSSAVSNPNPSPQPPRKLERAVATSLFAGALALAGALVFHALVRRYVLRAWLAVPPVAAVGATQGTGAALQSLPSAEGPVLRFETLGLVGATQHLDIPVSTLSIDRRARIPTLVVTQPAVPRARRFAVESLAPDSPLGALFITSRQAQPSVAAI